MAVGATALSAVAALVTGAVGFVLAGSYKPHATGADMASLADSVQRSAEWSDRHSVASIVLLAASIGSLLVVLWLGRTRALLHPVRVTAACVVAVVAAAVTVLTRARVEWDQLALWAVTVGEGIDGYWVAGFDEGVRFVIADGHEVSQGEYATALLVHLGAPVLAAVALLVAVWTLVRTPDIG
ncbi:MAG TPA: hypothetical protein VIR58_16025 [Acidimicrobiales bacterium]